MVKNFQNTLSQLPIYGENFSLKPYGLLKNNKPSYPIFFYYLIFFNVLFDVFAFWSEPGGFTAVLRVFTLYLVFLYFLFIKKINFRNNIFILAFSIYSVLQLFIAVDLEYSSKATFQIITSLLMFFVGYALIKNENDFYTYLKQFFLIYLLIIVNTTISNLYGIGVDDYSKSTDFVAGGLNDGWNTLTYSLIILPLLLHYRIQKSYFLYITSFLVLIFLLISLKRIAIVGVVFAAIVFFIFYKSKITLVKKTILFIGLLSLCYPIYSSLLFERIEIRSEQGRFTKDFYESEARFLEYNFLSERISEFNDPLEVVFGLKALDSRGVVGSDGRQFHIDYTLITYTLGVFGLILYLIIYYGFIKELNKIYFYLRRNIYLFKKFNLHMITALVLILSSLITSIGGQMYHISFRIIIFMTLGAIFKLLSKEISNSIKLSNAYLNSLQG